MKAASAPSGHFSLRTFLEASAIVVLCALQHVHPATASPLTGDGDAIIPPLLTREVTPNGGDLNGKTYDYVVVGGGLAGLTVAARLSEDPSVTVAVIEAGQDIYGPRQSRFLTPSAVFYDSFLNTEYDWKYVTTPQPGLGWRTTPWARGKVLGGSSAVNSMYMVRASRLEFDSWGTLIGAPGVWGWNAMFAAMKKSEGFQEPVQAVRDMVPSLRWNAASHGIGGPIKTGWPGLSYPFVQSFLDAASGQLGAPVTQDPDAGDSAGVFLATSAIDSKTWHRSSARTGYLDPIEKQRPNLHVLTGHQATKVLLDTSDPARVKATGVQYAAGPNQPLLSVVAAREVIVSGGTINSPQLLQLSGIGGAAHLAPLGIATAVDLPGVGHNVQDHISAALLHPPADPAKQPPSRITGDAVTDSFVQSAIAYVNMSTLVGAAKKTLLAELRANMSAVIDGAGVPEAVKAGWRVTYASQVDKIYDSPVGLVEILLADIMGTVNLQVALQQPLSRGTVLITTADPFAPPAIDPRYLSVGIDVRLLREGHKLARRIGAAMTARGSLGPEVDPGPAAVRDGDDAAWDAFVRQKAGTEYHPSSSCSMLPREVGGVVDASLRVYGTTNLRVVDASIAPTSVSAHLMTATYGIAEIAADIIKGERKTAAPAGVSPAGGGGLAQPMTSGGGDAADGPGDVDEDAAESVQDEHKQAVLAGGAVAAAGSSVLVAGLIAGRIALRRWQGQRYSKVQT